MSLADVRAIFRTASGRFDLVDNSNGDTGSDKLINAGQRWLDTLQYSPKSFSWNLVTLSMGNSVVEIPLARAIKNVFVDVDSSRVELKKVKLKDILDTYPSLTTDGRGTPIYFSSEVVGLGGSQEDFLSTDVSGFSDSGSILFGDHYSKMGITVAPVPDKDYKLRVLGLFFSRILVDDVDESFWTRNFPELLAWAACYQLEVLYRNTEGAKDWLGAINTQLRGVDFDQVEDSLVDDPQMGETP